MDILLTMVANASASSYLAGMFFASVKVLLVDLKVLFLMVVCLIISMQLQLKFVYGPSFTLSNIYIYIARYPPP